MFGIAFHSSPAADEKRSVGIVLLVTIVSHMTKPAHNSTQLAACLKRPLDLNPMLTASNTSRPLWRVVTGSADSQWHEK